MHANFVQLIPALLLLWLPRQTLRGLSNQIGKLRGHTRRSETNAKKVRSRREPGDSSVKITEEFKKLRNYIDLARAIAGAWLLLNGALVMEDGSNAHTLVALGIQASLLAVAVLSQTIRFDGKASLFAPTFFITGLVVIVGGWPHALFGVLLAWVFSIVLPNPGSFLLMMCVTVYAFGYGFAGLTNPNTLLSCLLIMIPASISFLLRKPLTVVNRRVTF